MVHIYGAACSYFIYLLNRQWFSRLHSTLASQFILIPKCTKKSIQTHTTVPQASFTSTTEESFESQSQTDYTWFFFFFPIPAELLSTTRCCEHIFTEGFLCRWLCDKRGLRPRLWMHFPLQIPKSLGRRRRIRRPGIIYLYLAPSV